MGHFQTVSQVLDLKAPQEGLQNVLSTRKIHHLLTDPASIIIQISDVTFQSIRIILKILYFAGVLLKR